MTPPTPTPPSTPESLMRNVLQALHLVLNAHTGPVLVLSRRTVARWEQALTRALLLARQQTRQEP